MLCSENCKCVDCENYEVCVERMAISGKEYDRTKSCKSFEGCEETVAVSCGCNSNTNICLYLEGCEEEMAVSGGDKKRKEICIQQAITSISAIPGVSRPSFSQTYKKRRFQKFLDLNDKDTPLQELKNDQKVFIFSHPDTTYCLYYLVVKERINRLFL